MTKTKQTFVDLMNQRSKLEGELFRINSAITALSWDYLRVLQDNTNVLLSPTEMLVIDLNERDLPLTQQEITWIFEQSGWAFTNDDIMACRPNSIEQVAEYRRREDY